MGHLKEFIGCSMLVTTDMVSLINFIMLIAECWAVLHITGVMKVSDIEKLNALRPLLVPRLVVGESLWSVLQSNGTVTLEMKQKIKSVGIFLMELAESTLCYCSSLYLLLFLFFRPRWK